jgi:hypothetical protein
LAEGVEGGGVVGVDVPVEFVVREILQYLFAEIYAFLVFALLEEGEGLLRVGKVIFRVNGDDKVVLTNGAIVITGVVFGDAGKEVWFESVGLR